RVRAGKLRVAAAPVATDGRVRVEAGDAEVVGAGGAELEVEVQRGVLDEVRVQRGTAQVIVRGQATVFLAAGKTWKRSVVTAVIDVVPAPLPLPVPVAPMPTTPPTPPRKTS